MSFKKDKLTSFVKGVPISLSIKELGECLSIPYVGAEIRTNFNAQLENYNKIDFYYSITRFSEDEIQQKRRMTSGIILECALWSDDNLTIDDEMLN